MKTSNFVVWTLAATIGFAGCSSTPAPPPAAAPPALAAAPANPPPAPAPRPAPVSSPANAGAGQPVAAPPVVTASLPPHLDPNHPVSAQRSVYFDFDNFELRSEFTDLLDRHGKYLASRPALAIRIEGNADERGSAEYNLALGQRRAQTVLRALAFHGVRDSQMEAVSWGEERPKARGHDEASWSENRRADLIYPRR